MTKKSEITSVMQQEQAFNLKEIDDQNMSEKMPIAFDEYYIEIGIEKAAMLDWVNSLNKYMKEESSIRKHHTMEYDAKFSIYAHLACSENDLMHGRVQYLDDAINEILSDLNDLV